MVWSWLSAVCSNEDLTNTTWETEKAKLMMMKQCSFFKRSLSYNCSRVDWRIAWLFWTWELTIFKMTLCRLRTTIIKNFLELKSKLCKTCRIIHCLQYSALSPLHYCRKLRMYCTVKSIFKVPYYGQVDLSNDLGKIKP